MVDSTSRIRQERDAIDALDAHIIELLTQRARVSSGIQKLRTDASGPRTVFTREMEISPATATASASAGHRSR
jgi:chorismate mutase